MSWIFIFKRKSWYPSWAENSIEKRWTNWVCWSKCISETSLKTEAAIDISRRPYTKDKDLELASGEVKGRQTSVFVNIVKPQTFGFRKVRMSCLKYIFLFNKLCRYIVKAGPISFFDWFLQHWVLISVDLNWFDFRCVHNSTLGQEDSFTGLTYIFATVFIVLEWRGRNNCHSV